MADFRPILDSRCVDTSKFDNVEEGDLSLLPDYEIKPLKMFLGAWYRKVVSPLDTWLGIEGEIELGEFVPDKARFNLDGKGRYQDNPNVYMGGLAKYESDCGIGYNIMYKDADTSYPLGIDAPKLGYRPFFRYIYRHVETKELYTNVYNVNSWNNIDPKETGYYYFPGDIVRMKVYSPVPNYLQLRVELVRPTTIPKYVELRKGYGLKDDLPLTYYSPMFLSEGQGAGPCVFKRVNSIDQYGNEGNNAQNTNAFLNGAKWHNCYLYKEVGGKLLKFPFIEKLQSTINCPNEQAIEIEKFNSSQGGEKISIHPAGCKNC